MSELYRAAGSVAWLDSIVRDLGHEEITKGVLSIRTGEKAGERVSREITTVAATNVWVKLWQDERDRLARVAEACHRVRIDTARIELARAQGELLRGVIDGILGAMLARLVSELGDRVQGIDSSWRSWTQEIVPAQLLASATNPTIERQTHHETT